MQSPEPNRTDNWLNRLRRYQGRIASPPLVVEGKLTRMVGLTLEAVGCQAAIGGRCVIAAPGTPPIEAEVVGFSGEKLFLMPTGDIRGLVPNARVIPTNTVCEAVVGLSTPESEQQVRAFFEARYSGEELEQLAGLLGRLPGAADSTHEDCTA